MESKMENSDIHDCELDELCVNTAIDILLERAQAGDKAARHKLKSLHETLGRINRESQN